MAHLDLSLLGGFQARLESGSPLALPTKKAQALLGYLAIPLGQAHARDKLAALLWGEIREESARASLRQALFAIRKALGETRPPALLLEGETLALNRSVVDVDVAAFERLVAEGTPEALEKAATLYQGDLLAGLAVDEALFEEWLVTQRERLRELALEGLTKLLAHQRKAGTAEAAVQTALKLLALDPLQEPAHRTLMRLYAEQGRRGSALRQYQQCVSALQQELGVEPEPETKALYQDVLRQRLSSTTASAQVAPRPPESAPRPTAPAVETPLIGRGTELAQLTEALAQAGRGHGRMIGIVGEAGIGKTRLVAELAVGAEQGGARVLLGRSYESEQVLPFGPWVNAFRAGHVFDELAGMPRAWRAELSRLMPELAAPGAQPPAGAADYRQLFEAVAQGVSHLARAHPVLVVLEDLQWADEMSLRLLPFVGRWIGTWPVLTVFTAREEELADAPVLRHAIHEMAKEDVLSSLLLGPLSRPETMTLVRTLMRSGSEEAAVARLAEQAWALSEGNPFVAVETVRAQAQGAVLVQGGRPGLPQLVRDIVTRRLDRLSERGRMLVAVAAVVGREFDFALVQRAAGLGEAEAAEAVEELVRRRVLHGVGELFDFTHDRIREVAYAELLPPRRKLLHRQVAEALEAVYVGDLAPHHVALGTHHREAGAWDKAVTHLEKAGAAAEARAANREAVACFDAALEALQHLSDMRETTERAIDIRLQLEQALMGLGEFRRSMERLREAESLAHRLGDRGRLARVFSRMTYNLDSLGDLAGAVEKGEQAFAIAMEVGDLRAQVSTNDVVARAYYGLGQYRRAIDAARRNEELAAANPAHSNLIRRSLSFSRIWAILALAEVAEFVEGMVRGEEATRVSHAELGLHDHVFACLGVGRLYVVKGELQRAIEVLERSLPSCESGGDLAAYFARTAASLGAAYAWSGRLPEALPLLERAMRQAESIEFMYGYPLVVSTLAEAHQLAGHSEEALRLADRALEFVRRYRQSGWEAWTLRLHGEIAARGDYPERAENFYREAMALAGERGMRPLLAHCRAGLGLTQARCGRQEQALAEHRAAIEMYRVLDMPFWAARAEAELASVR